MGSINIFKPLSTFLKAASLNNLSHIDNLFPPKCCWECWESNLLLGPEASMLTIVPWPHANLNKDWCLKKLSIEFKERGKRVRNLWWEIYLMCVFENFDTFDFGSWIQETKSLRIARITKTTFLSQKSFQVTDIERLHWHFWRMAQKKKKKRR